MNRKSKDPERVADGSAPIDAQRDCIKAPQDGEPKADSPLPPDIAVIAASRLAKSAARAATLLFEVPGVDLAYRPKTYFWSRGLQAHLPANAKQSSRMTALQRFIVGDHLDESANDFPQSDRGLHLRFEEVLIARITISSIGRDVTCVYARIGEDCIHYEVADEYSGQTLSGPRECTSLESLTLEELETFFNGAWSIYDVLEMNFGHRDFEVEDALDFVETIDSEFYPELDRLYRARITAWAIAGRSEPEQWGDRAAA